MKKESMLILFFNDATKQDPILEAINDIEGTDAKSVFKPVGKIGAAIRKLHLKSHLPGIQFWLLDWKYCLEKYDSLVCIASPYSPQILKWVKRKKNGIHLINYFWDCVEISGYPVVKDAAFENWSFNRRNCEEYDMKYNPQFFVDSINLPDNKKQYDVVFVGADRNGLWKSRAEMVQKCFNLFESMGISSCFWFLSKSDKVAQSIRKHRILEVDEYHDLLGRASTMLDLVEPGLEWMTLRPLLAMSNQKKLITNDTTIVNEKFYNEQNIFILGKDDIQQLKQFVSTPFTPIEKRRMEYYSVSNWILRFKEEEVAE